MANGDWWGWVILGRAFPGFRRPLNNLSLKKCQPENWHDIFHSFGESFNHPPNFYTPWQTQAKTVATLLIGAAIGTAVGYVLATDKDSRSEQLDNLKDRFNKLKDKYSKKGQDLEQEIYNA